MPLLAQSADLSGPGNTVTNTGAVIGGFGLIALLQVLSMIFKKHGDKEPLVEELRGTIDSLEALVGQTAVTVATLSAQQTSANKSFQEEVLRQQVNYQHTLDTVDAVNTTIHRRMDLIDSMVRGNGREGLITIVARQDMEIKATKHRADEAKHRADEAYNAVKRLEEGNR